MKLDAKIVLIVFILVVMTPFVFAGEVQPTTFWSQNGNSLLNGQPIPASSIITAYDPAGTLCKNFTVTTTGEFVFECTGDNPDTGGIDEGGVTGDIISFRVNGSLAILIGGNATWAEAEWREINISATIVNCIDNDLD